MISISNKSRLLLCAVNIALAGSFLLPSLLHAQESLSLSVTPTLIQMAGERNQNWESQIRIVNSNSFPITVYADVANFAPQGEAGHGRFIPVFEEVTDGSTLAEWIEIPREPIEIAAERSVNVPITVNVPDDASPGGHFAAILVSTQPPESEEKMLVRTNQIVSSLFFVRIAGDVVEQGHIRAFSVDDSFVERPTAKLSLRFENEGNVQLQPQGQITIENMWGKVRGTIPINMQTHFGNVLPNSIRKFEFTWNGERSVTDIGRYTAKVSLAYGQESKKFETREVHFWVVPFKPLLITLLVLAIVIWLIIWMVRSYVRRMLSLAGLDPDHTNLPGSRAGSRSRIVYEGDVTVRNTSERNLSAPMRSGWSDFKTRLSGMTPSMEMLKVLFDFVLSYKKFFVSVVLLILIFIGGYLYFSDVGAPERDYTVSIENPDQAVELNSEEIKLQELQSGLPAPVTSVEQNFNLSVVNVSDRPGTAAFAAHQLIQSGYTIHELHSETARTERSSAVVFDASVQDEALNVSKLLGGVLPSFAPETDASSTPSITVYVGQDLIELHN